ncbi:MAG: type II toxin-antitoxin system VapC family toxin [Alphaproteobacteria bacterium]
MSLYLDTSVLVALFTNDLFSSRAHSFLRTHEAVVIVSDFPAAEFASAVGRRLRLGKLTHEEAVTVFSTFDAWTARAATRAETIAADVATAAAYLRRLDVPLRTPDALNIAIAERVGAELLTFDDKMSAAARALGAKAHP